MIYKHKNVIKSQLSSCSCYFVVVFHFWYFPLCAVFDIWCCCCCISYICVLRAFNVDVCNMSICNTKTSAALQIPIGENSLPTYSLPHQLLLLLLLLLFLLLLQPCVFQFNFNFLLSIYISLSLAHTRSHTPSLCAQWCHLAWVSLVCAYRRMSVYACACLYIC